MRANFLAQAQSKTTKSSDIRFGGPARCGRRTKTLAKFLQPGEIAVIDHEDLDSVGAQMLVEKHVGGVVNLSPSISGRYPNRGPSILLNAHIPLFDCLSPELMDSIRDGSALEVKGDQLYVDGVACGMGEHQTKQVVDMKLEASWKNLDSELQSFAKNTFDYASQEVTQLLSPTHPPMTRTVIRDRHVLVVTRGEGFKKDLRIIRGYINGVKPVLIAVDGGADALLELGLKPHIIVGDMDSVSDSALKCGAEIIVHTYTDGRESPGLARVKALGVPYQEFAVPGTSEDAAMLLAFEHGAELIVAVGTHSNLYDFLDKGRGGMASTLLVRMRIGSRLVDARGVSKLYSSRSTSLEIAILVLVALVFMAVVVQQSEPLRNWFILAANWFKIRILQWRLR